MSINRIALYHLETLFWIERLGTFAAAADRLNTTQPAVSARMRELEQRVGTGLFRRDGRQMSLTPAARKLVRECEPLLRQMQTALLGSGSFGEASGVVRIGAGEIAAASVLPDFLADLKREMPNVALEVDIDLTANLIQQLLTGRTDMAFAAGPIAHPALKSVAIGAVPLLWLARTDVAAAYVQGPQDARRPVPFWSLASHSPIHGRMRDAIASLNVQQKSLNLSNNARLMIDIAKSGGGIGIFPQTMVQAELQSGALVMMPDMPQLEPMIFHASMRVSDSDPLLTRIFDQASRLNMHDLRTSGGNI
jgi:DNA-binding transcriptional LysR family regulator